MGYGRQERIDMNREAGKHWLTGNIFQRETGSCVVLSGNVHLVDQAASHKPWAHSGQTLPRRAVVSRVEIDPDITARKLMRRRSG
jgi:hypothetical protein